MIELIALHTIYIFCLPKKGTFCMIKYNLALKMFTEIQIVWRQQSPALIFLFFVLVFGQVKCWGTKVEQHVYSTRSERNILDDVTFGE